MGSDSGRVTRMEGFFMPDLNIFTTTARDIDESPAVLPPDVLRVVHEFARLASEAYGHLSQGRLFPCLSTLTGLTPVLGYIRDYCMAEVLPSPTDHLCEAPKAQEDMVFAGQGLYL